MTIPQTPKPHRPLHSSDIARIGPWQYQADIYWVAGAALAADTSYVVSLQARNDCGPARLDVRISAPPPSGD